MVATFDAVSTLEKFVCMDLSHVSSLLNLVSVYPRSIKLGQITSLKVIFHMVVSVDRLVKLKTRPSEYLNQDCFVILNGLPVASQS